MAKKPKPNRWQWITGSVNTLRNLAAAVFFMSATLANVGQATEEVSPRLDRPEWCHGMLRAQRVAP